MSKPKVKVPDGLREILLEFSIAYLLEQPGDIVDYAVDFFTKLQANRSTTGGGTTSSTKPMTPDESIISQDEEPIVNRFASRRKSVFAEQYDPEEDDDAEENNKVIFPKTDEQRQRLCDSVKNILLFRSLDPEQMNEILDAMFEKKVKANDFIIKQGDDGDNFYVIESGIYKAYVGEDNKHVHTYENRGSFGELALLYNMPRAATIKADSDGQLWALDRQTFRRILLKSAFRKRKMYETLINSVPMLKTLQNYERLNLADALIPKSYAAGDQIIKQGDAADGMYFIEDGTVSIKIFQDGGEVEISKLEKGQYFGELALVTHRPRAASAYAMGTVKVAFLDVDAFERLLGPCMDIMKRNIDDYESQLVKIFGSKNNIADIR
jgi:cAMP-dependent protein kinase regulator